MAAGIPLKFQTFHRMPFCSIFGGMSVKCDKKSKRILLHSLRSLPPLDKLPLFTLGEPDFPERGEIKNIWL